MNSLTLEQTRTIAAERIEMTERVKKTLINCLALEKTPSDIPNDCMLFGIGLGLDSVDALEIVVAIDVEFGVRLEDRDMREIRSVNSITNLIISKNKKQEAV